jgi:uncharacterized protein
MGPPVVERHSLELVERALESFRIVVVNGPRQAGKSTLVELLHGRIGGTRITLDDRDSLRAAKTDPGGLVAEATFPLMIDEVQRGGDPLVLAIKSDVDRHGFANGRFVLAGSSRFLTVPSLSESLAGRARIIDLWPFSQAEIEGVRPRFVDALFSSPSDLRSQPSEPSSRSDIFQRVVTGGFPAAVRIRDPRYRDDWFGDYLATLLQRDLAELRTPRRSVDLRRIVRLLAQRTANELVVAPLSSDLGLAADTVKDYVGLLESIFFHHLIPAWTAGGSGRAIHRPKLHVVDSGLACHVLGLNVDKLAAVGSAAAGAVLESFILGELQRHIPWSAERPTMYHYRDKEKREIDIVLESRDGRVAAIEVKAARDVDDDDFRHLRWFRDTLGDRFVNGVVVHLGERVLPAGDRLTSIPVSTLWTPVK